MPKVYPDDPGLYSPNKWNRDGITYYADSSTQNQDVLRCKNDAPSKWTLESTSKTTIKERGEVEFKSFWAFAKVDLSLEVGKE